MTLTETILKLLENEENRELVNTVLSGLYVKQGWKGLNFSACGRSAWKDELTDYQWREVIRVCLDCLPFFDRENPEITKAKQIEVEEAIVMEELKARGKACPASELYLVIADMFKCGLRDGEAAVTIKTAPKTLRQKYQQLLYLPIPELDAKFEAEGINESDL